MISVYFCTMPLTPERSELSVRMLEWWKEQQCNVQVITPEVIGCEPEDFNRQRRIFADETCCDWAHIVTDDDCELLTPQMIREGIEALRKNEDFGILSAYPMNATIHPWTPEDYIPRVTDDVMEHVSVGGIRFTRTGAVKYWPESKRVGFDAEHCQALRDRNFRTGYAMKVKMIHHGEGVSDLWASHALLKNT